MWRRSAASTGTMTCSFAVTVAMAPSSSSLLSSCFLSSPQYVPPLPCGCQGRARRTRSDYRVLRSSSACALAIHQRLQSAGSRRCRERGPPVRIRPSCSPQVHGHPTKPNRLRFPMRKPGCLLAGRAPTIGTGAGRLRWVDRHGDVDAPLWLATAPQLLAEARSER
jgi:hypothetical protein